MTHTDRRGHLHRGDGGGRTGVSGEGREGGLSTGLLDVVVRLASREVRADVSREWRGLGNDLRAVDERALVDTEKTETTEDVRERLLELLLVVRERLPLASSARVTGEEVVGLQPHLTAQGRGHRTLNTTPAGEGLTTELGLEEELGVEDLGGRVERRARDGGVDEVGGGDGVGGEEPDDLEVLEADVEEPSEDLVNRV